MRRIVLLLLFLVFFSTLKSQPFSFQHYSVEQGLSQSVVKCIFQDSEGFIWIGTQDGLNCFDGYQFKKYMNNPLDTNSIADNWIYSIAQTSDGYLWIGTRNGLQRFDKRSEKFTQYKRLENNKGLYSNTVYGVAVSRNNEIIVNTPPAISFFNPKTNTFRHFINEKIEYDGAIIDEKLPIIEASNNSIWLATTRGVSSFHIPTQTFKTYKYESYNPNSLPHSYISDIEEDTDGNIWIGTQNGLCLLEKNSQTILKINNQSSNPNSLSHNFIRSILLDSYGNLWIGTDGGGLNFLSAANKKNRNWYFVHYHSNSEANAALSHDIVLDLFEDRSRVLWIGTLNGVDKTDLKPKKFGLIQKSNNTNSVELLDNVVAAIYKGNDHRVWIGNWGKGLNIYNRQTGEIEYFAEELSGKNHIPNNFVHAIFNDTKNRLWIGSRNGVLIFDTEKKAFIQAGEYLKMKQFPNFSNNRIYEILQDKRGVLWFATQNGLYEIDVDKQTVNLFKSEANDNRKLSDNLIYELHLDSKNRLWIGTSKGLDCYSIADKKITSYRKNKQNINSLCDNFIVSLNEDMEGNIWIGTKSGLNRLSVNDSVFFYFSEKEGLPSNVIYEIVRDFKGGLWFATGRGLASYDTHKQQFRVYTMDDGLQSLEFNTACHLAYDGEVFFGGMQGVNYFYPDSLYSNAFAPKVVINGFEIENEKGKQAIDFDTITPIVLKYNNFAFNIQFAALEFTNPQKNQYQYRMEGISDEWISIGERNFVPFAKLPAGKYIFSVKGANSDGIWSEYPTKLRIEILPPWWRSRFAYFVYIFSTLLAIFLLVKFRERNLIRIRNILEQKVIERTKEIAAQKEVIEKKNDDITASINYASRIQSALLPPDEVITEILQEHFILFKPRDIVSGDFYWLKNIGDGQNPQYVIVAADCTGHGVPGAFMSMLGVALLNEITVKGEKHTAASILESMRQKVKISLRQTGKDGETKDGMDIALCIFEPKKLHLQFAGAYNPLYIISDNELIEYKATRSPIGIYIKEKQFENNEIELKPNDCFYIFTDGFHDQSSEAGAKFKTLKFKALMLGMGNLSMTEQKVRLEKVHEEWKGKAEQTDDILVIGVRV